MNRYRQLFDSPPAAGRIRINTFTTLGFPDKERSLEIIRTLISAGADMLELGLPFSDPVADGPVLQEAGHIALQNGFRYENALEIIHQVRSESDLPIGLLCYGNSVMAPGPEKFYRDMADAGLDSVLIADVPPEESGIFHKAAVKNGIDPVYIVSGLSSGSRLEKILTLSDAFIYLVTRFGVTGLHSRPGTQVREKIKEIRRTSDLPVLTGFGISTPADVRAMTDAGADGVIIGTAIVRIIREHLNTPESLNESLKEYLSSMAYPVLPSADQDTGFPVDPRL